MRNLSRFDVIRLAATLVNIKMLSRSALRTLPFLEMRLQTFPSNQYSGEGRRVQRAHPGRKGAAHRRARSGRPDRRPARLRRVIATVAALCISGCAWLPPINSRCADEDACAARHEPGESWDQGNLKRNDSGCPTAIYRAPGGHLEQC